MTQEYIGYEYDSLVKMQISFKEQYWFIYIHLLIDRYSILTAISIQMTSYIDIILHEYCPTDIYLHIAEEILHTLFTPVQVDHDIKKIHDTLNVYVHFHMITFVNLKRAILRSKRDYLDERFVPVMLIWFVLRKGWYLYTSGKVPDLPQKLEPRAYWKEGKDGSRVR